MAHCSHALPGNLRTVPIVQTIARRTAGILGRNSALIRNLRPAYESLLGRIHGGRGIPWTVNGVEYRIDPGQRPRFGQRYEEEAAGFLSHRITPGMTCFDIGANVGAYVLQLAHWSQPQGKIVAFEPNAGAREVLAQHVAWNGLASRVQIVPAAVAAEPGELTLYAAGADGMSRLAAANNALVNTAAQTRVPVTTIDAFCRQSKAIPDVLLLDIEGFEIEALRGARETILSLRPLIVVEMHPNVWNSSNTTRAGAEALLRELSLRPVALSGQKDPLEDHGQVYLEPF